MSTIFKEIDFKSFLIGILLTMVVVLFVAGKPVSDGVMKVHIVECSSDVAVPVSQYENEYQHVPPLEVKIVDMSSKLEFPVKAVEEKLFEEKPVLNVKITEIAEGIKVPVTATVSESLPVRMTAVDDDVVVKTKKTEAD